ncbi:MAG: membrane protein insertion efficiency factor YidD [Treponema sp.]|jgi:putative membrane protein insertion efficiency factor|nr:membrane protein insertion efficiency factor YidD [Treponema sp.]
MNIGQKFGCLLIRLYQYTVAQLFPGYCRYMPSCSEYTFVAIEKYGLLKGSFLAFKRILRCHPFHAGGWDPVP